MERTIEARKVRICSSQSVMQRFVIGHLEKRNDAVRFEPPIFQTIQYVAAAELPPPCGTIPIGSPLEKALACAAPVPKSRGERCHRDVVQIGTEGSSQVQVEIGRELVEICTQTGGSHLYFVGQLCGRLAMLDLSAQFDKIGVVGEGWLYVAVVLDLFSRRAVGWSMKADRDASLVMDALMMAVWRRGKADALRHHSDQGSQ